MTTRAESPFVTCKIDMCSFPRVGGRRRARFFLS
jgi:hypothetical protein